MAFHAARGRTARTDPGAAAAAPARDGGAGTAVFAIVGIGASAGGLQALEQFLGKVPANPGLAFVVVQQRYPSDHFFASLAADRRDGAVGVIHAGTGSADTVGLRATRAGGGSARGHRP